MNNVGSPVGKGRILLRRLLKVVLLMVLILVFLAGGLLAFVRFGLKGNQVAKVLVDQAKNKSGKLIEYKSADLVWYSVAGFKITIRGLRIAEKDSAKIADVPNLLVDADLAPLIRGKLLVNSVDLDKPVFYLRCGPPNNSGHKKNHKIPPIEPVIQRLRIQSATFILPGRKSGE
jgi:hypothetical protein